MRFSLRDESLIFKAYQTQRFITLRLWEVLWQQSFHPVCSLDNMIYHNVIYLTGQMTLRRVPAKVELGYASLPDGPLGRDPCCARCSGLVEMNEGTAFCDIVL